MNYFKIIIILIFLLVSPCIVFEASAVPPPDVTAIPIDGGLTILIVSGLAYGAKKLYNQRNIDNSSQTENV